VHAGVDNLEHDFGNLAKRPSDSVTNVEGWVRLHQANERTKSLSDEGSKSSSVGAVKDGSKSHDSCLSVLPFGTTDTSFHERDNGLNNIVTDVTSKELEARSSRHRPSPVIVIIVLFLL
jgi:hypothetical protein